LIRTGRDLPVMTPLLNNNDLEAARMVSYNKAPLVFRSLAYAVGPGLFQDTLSSFYYMHRHRSIELRDFRATLEGVTGDGYEWFFDRWFYGTSDIDFSIQDWSEKITPEGHVVEVVVRRRPVLPLPVTVALYTADGNRHTQGWNTPEAETTLRFVVPSGTKRVVIDPDEYWLESNRKNNYSEKLFRIRPFFDWSKQREILITLQGLMGGNAIDGNYLGLGMRIQFDEKNSLYLLPIYGERTGLVNYEISWQKSPFIFSGMRGSLSLQHLGGISTHSAGVEYMAYQRGKNTLELGVKLNLEQVEGATYEENGSVIEQPISKADNVTYSLGYSLEPNSQMDTNLFLEFSRSLNSLESDYEFDIFAGYLLQALNAPPNSALLINLLRGATTGETPFQKRFFIGGPEMLRGYPRDPLLSYDEYVGMRMDYRYIFSRKIFGSAYQTRRFTAILSSDVARGWNDGENWRKTTIRRNAGVGLEVMINVLSIVEFPVIMEVSRPIADEEYKDTQIILFGVFSF
ncbi:MAG: hypothetical protein OEZ59_13845, partial [Deltaproteobacteria bacterium]|nr:hypothetical protein [Deltaproteobacteria bacterium]